jgi:hypothetical protein
MTARAVKLKVFASVPKDCSFWVEDDGWNGVCEELSVTVRGSSFEDAKTKMEAALQAERVSRAEMPGRIDCRASSCRSGRSSNAAPHTNAEHGLDLGLRKPLGCGSLFAVGSPVRDQGEGRRSLSQCRYEQKPLAIG